MEKPFDVTNPATGMPDPPTGLTIYLPDMEKCFPQSLLSRDYEIGRWRLVDYASDSFEGRMLFAGEEAAAPEITYPLNIRGWYAISIGMYQERYMGPAAVQVRLTGDPAFTILSVEDEPVRILEDVFWKVADLTGQQISFKQHQGAMNKISATFDAKACIQAKVAYIRLDPLSDEEVRSLQAERQRGDTRRLFAHNDAGMPIIYMQDGSAGEWYREIEPYRHTDFSRMYWEAGYGDLMTYPSALGRSMDYAGMRSFPRIVDRVIAENSRTLLSKGLDPLRLVTEHAHAVGMELHASYRPAGFYSPPFEDLNNQGSFYVQHPELSAVARDGGRVPRLSFSFPESRRYVLSLFREIAQYPIDGICLLYIRRPPLVEYEPPLVEGFKRQYGEDPFRLDPNDPRWLKYRCGVLNEFMREVRQEMDAVASDMGRARRIEVSAIVSGRHEENFKHGMDVPQWISEGLVDTIIPYTMAPQLDSAAESWTDMRDAAHWVSLTRGSACKLAFSILPRYMSPEAYWTKANQLYQAGAEYLFFWDCAGRVNYTNQHQWNALRRLGHKEEIAAWVAAGQPSLAPIQKTLARLGDWNMAYETPG